MSTLMITPYAPWRDGIANYAVQEVARMRAEGEDVQVCSPEPSAAHIHLDLRSRRGPLALAKRIRGYDRVIIQFHPDMFFRVGMTSGRVTEQLMGLTLAARAAKRLEIRVHEVEYVRGLRDNREARWWRRFWSEVDEITVHTEAERDRFVDAFQVDPNKIQLADHGAHFERRTTASRAQARKKLGISQDAFTFISIGFLQPHKGFDRALQAFGQLGAADAELHVVGSVRVEDAVFADHLALLHELADGIPNAYVHEAYVDDVQFDEWLVASDVVVLPYRYIWSSSVIERAGLYERPVIATRVGGLAHQAPANARLVDDDVALLVAMREAWQGRDRSSSDPEQSEGGVQSSDAQDSGPWGTLDASATTANVQEMIRSRSGSVRTGKPLASGAPKHSAALRQVQPIVPPVYGNMPITKALVMRVVRRLTAWQVVPIEQAVNDLRHSSVKAIESIESEAPGPASSPSANQSAT